MRSTREQRRSAWKLRALFGAVLALVAISLSSSSRAGRVEPTEQVSQVFAAAVAPEASSLAHREMQRCLAGQAAITADDIAIGAGIRCLPMGGDEVPGSRLDPRYSRIAAELVARISGQTKKRAGSVKVICWSDEDSRELSIAFAEAGRTRSGEFRLGWVSRGRQVINLSSLACLQLDRITYHDSDLALPATGAAVGALAHEAMHVSGIHDEGIAECYGMQLTAMTAVRLGAERRYAYQLRAVNYEFDREQRAGTAYDSPDCYDGGPLDLAPSSTQWP